MYSITAGRSIAFDWPWATPKWAPIGRDIAWKVLKVPERIETQLEEEP